MPVDMVKRIEIVVDRVIKHERQGDDIVVVSAISGETNCLIELAKSIQSALDT